MKISIVGLGFVGLSLTSVLAARGNNILGIDTDKNKCKNIQIVVDGKKEISDTYYIADKAKGVILPLVESGKEVHINLKDVSYMDSSGISVLIESHQKAEEKNTKVIIKEISKSVLKVIMMAKLEQVLNLG